MKRIASLILALVMVVSIAVTNTYAMGKMPPGLAKKGGLPPGIAKKFLDIDGYKWAEDAIERMAEKGVIMGVGEGKFAPKRAVTKLEAVVMALRIMGEDGEAREYLEDIKIGKKKFKLKDYLQEWSYGYVALAEDKGILDEADILYFKLNDPATRHEVAKYLVRAIGKEDKAQSSMNEDLDFTDASFIPQGSVGYIYIANKEEIITGYEDDTFRPNNYVTRAEMAVMVSRLEGKVDEKDEELDIYRGEVTDIDTTGSSKSIEIENDDEFTLTNDTEVVFEDDVEGDIEDIEVGDEIKVKVNEDDEAVYIEVDRELETKEYVGSVVDIDQDDDEYEISVYTSNKVIEFTVDDDFEIDFDDEEGTAEDLRIGDEVEVTVEDDEVIEIAVNRDIDAELINGKLLDVYEDEEKIAIKNNNDIKIYSLDDDVKVYLNGERVDLADLEADDNVRLAMDDNKVIVIKAYRY